MTVVSRRQALGAIGATALYAVAPLRASAQTPRMQSWPLKTPECTGIHDVVPAPDGGVWFTAQASGHLGYFDPATGDSELIALGPHSAPHGVIQGPDKAAWITDGGQQAIVRVSWPDRGVRAFPLPPGTRYANLNTCAFDGDANLWFTGQSGVIGRLASDSARITLWDAPHGRGPYGICSTPSGDIWWASLAGSFIANVDRATGASSVVAPPTKNQGARRVWSDSGGRIWVSEWMSGNLSMYDPAAKSWRTFPVPGENPRTYAVYVDDRDKVWVSEWTGNAVYCFDPASGMFERFGFPREGAGIRQILGRHGEVWLPESGTDYISVIGTV